MTDIFYVHVNRNRIDSNRKRGSSEPTMRYQKGRFGRSTYGHEIELPTGSRIVELAEPLPCGARVVIQSSSEPRIIR